MRLHCALLDSRALNETNNVVAPRERCVCLARQAAATAGRRSHASHHVMVDILERRPLRFFAVTRLHARDIYGIVSLSMIGQGCSRGTTRSYSV